MAFSWALPVSRATRASGAWFPGGALGLPQAGKVDLEGSAEKMFCWGWKPEVSEDRCRELVSGVNLARPSPRAQAGPLPSFSQVGPLVEPARPPYLRVECT